MAMGGEMAIAKQHALGKLTARERVDTVLDAGTFQEMGILTGKASYEKDGTLKEFVPSNAIIGIGRIGGRKVSVTADDFTIRGGSSESTNSDKWIYAERLAYELRMPLVRLVDTAGGSVKLLDQQQSTKFPGYPSWPIIPLLGVVPVVGVALGSCAGLGAMKVLASHFSVMVRETSQNFRGGAPGREAGFRGRRRKERDWADTWCTPARAASWTTRPRTSGMPSPRCAASSGICPAMCGSCRRELNPPTPPIARRSGSRARSRSTGAKSTIRAGSLEAILDRDSIFEIGRYHGGSLITCLARLGGIPVGVMASDPRVAGGAMTLTAANKTERFVEMCDLFHIPVVNFVDQPGTMTGVEAEAAGTLLGAVRVAKMIERSTVPWISIIVRRAFGLAGGLHGRKQGVEGRSLNHRFAWPSARWGSIPIEGGVAAAFRRDIESAPDPVARRNDLEGHYNQLASPFRTAERFGIVDIIDPRRTRAILCDWAEDAWAVVKTQLGPH